MLFPLLSPGLLGVAGNELTETLKTATTSTQTTVQHLLAEQIYRPEPSQFWEIYEQMTDFLTTVGNPERLLALVEIFSSTEMGSAGFQNGVQQELLVQSSCRQFCENLQQQFPCYRDIIEPFIFAVNFLQYGLRALAFHRTPQGPTSTLTAVQQLAACLGTLGSPLASWSAAFDYFLSPETFTTAHTVCGLTLALSTSDGNLPSRCSGEGTALWPANPTGFRTIMTAVQARVGQLLQNGVVTPTALLQWETWVLMFGAHWFAREELQASATVAAATAVKYKEKSHEFQNDEQQEALQVFTQFPSYLNLFSDLENIEDQNPEFLQHAATPAAKVPSTPGLADLTAAVQKHWMTEEFMQQLMQGFTAIVLPPSASRQWPGGVGNTLDNATSAVEPLGDRSRPLLAATSAAVSVLNETTGFQQPSLETVLLPLLAWRCGSLVQALAVVAGEENPAQASVAPLSIAVGMESAVPPVGQPGLAFDFYKDPHVTEACGCTSILLALDQHLRILLEEWPEHPILLAIHAVTQRILAFTLESPLAKILTGLDMLLAKMHEWESTASKRVSLVVAVTQVSTLAIRWRRLELRCWVLLLDKEENRVFQTVDSEAIRLLRLVTLEPSTGR